MRGERLATLLLMARRVQIKHYPRVSAVIYTTAGLQLVGDPLMHSVAQYGQVDRVRQPPSPHSVL